MSDPTQRIVPAAAIDALPRPSRFAVPDQRYQGTHAAIGVGDLPEADRAAIAELYQRLHTLYEVLTPYLDNPTPVALHEAVRSFVASEDWRRLRALAFGLGTAPGASVHVQHAYHDIKGGALSALVLQLDMLAQGMLRDGELDRIFLLVRDHLKILRNAVRDLDPEGYARDLQTKRHAASLLTTKWDHRRHRVEGNEAVVHLHSRFQGDIAERCMEFASLDRVLYNLVNNATRHALLEPRVDVMLAPVADGGTTQVRIAVANRIPLAHGKVLRQRFGGSDVSGLFLGGYTTEGSGLGMRIAAEFVSRGYGLLKVKDAIAQHYVGAHCEGRVFIAWFHWPAAATAG